MSDPTPIIGSMNEWKNPNLINEDVIKSLTPDQLKRLSEILAKVK